MHPTLALTEQGGGCAATTGFDTPTSQSVQDIIRTAVSSPVCYSLFSAEYCAPSGRPKFLFMLLSFPLFFYYNFLLLNNYHVNLKHTFIFSLEKRTAKVKLWSDKLELNLS